MTDVKDAAGPFETVRVRLSIAYDGTHFHGWGRQAADRTVQGVLEDALAVLLRRAGPGLRLTVAGRTDAGVHALGQVAHVDLSEAHVTALSQAQRGNRIGPQQIPAELARRVNGVLGASADVVVLRAEYAAPGFDARFSAIWRRYEYRVADPESVRDPLQRHRTLWHPTRLDRDAMQAAADTLLGLHDFAAYCRSRPDATTIRTLQAFDWTRDGDGVLIAAVQADAFCHSMVRSLVGSCVAVGEGRLPRSRPALLLGERDRSSEFPVMPAKGLTLTEVGYPPAADLADRARVTRARRTPAP